MDPYRDPAPAGSALEDVEAPSSWRRASSRVLGALARLHEARGASDTAVDFDDRARRARDEEPPLRQLPRCTVAHELMSAGAFARAHCELTAWVEDATVLASNPRDRMEAQLCLAAIAHAEARYVDVDQHLRRARAMGPLRVARDVPDAVPQVAAQSLLALGHLDEAELLLRDRAPRHDRDATTTRLQARLALERDELAHAQILAGESLDREEHPATRLLVARIHLRAGRQAEGERAIAAVVEQAGTSLVLAEAWGLAATALAGRNDRARALRALFTASDLARAIAREPCTAVLTLTVEGARVLHAVSESALGSAWDEAAEHVRAGFRSSR